MLKNMPTFLRKLSLANWYVGGHSASGMAAVEALNKNLFPVNVKEFVGLDPYEYKSNSYYNLHIPSIIWTMKGSTTCMPNAEASGKGFYGGAASANNSCNTHQLYTFTDGTGHCVFTNDGCPILGCSESGSISLTASHDENVADSVAKFMTSVVVQNASTPYNNTFF